MPKLTERAAIELLLKYYQGEKVDFSDYQNECPLCDLGGKCKDCPWMKYEHTRCANYTHNEFGFAIRQLRDIDQDIDVVDGIPESEKRKWRKDSIKRLKRWLKIIDKNKSEDRLNG